MINEIQIGKEIKNKRLLLNMTMDNVAAKANITRATLSSIEKGNCNVSIKNLIQVLQVLDMNLIIQNTSISNTRIRATRLITIQDKKINRFIVMCIEQYAIYKNKPSFKAYQEMKEKNIIADLKEDYEDLHGMSTIYLNDYIDKMMRG